MPEPKKAKRPRPNGQEIEEDPELKLYPHRFAVLSDNSIVKVSPWPYLKGRELMFGPVAALIDKYNLFDPSRPAFDVVGVGEADLIAITQRHFEWDDATLAAMAYEDVLECVRCVWDVNISPIVEKWLGLVVRMAPMVASRTGPTNTAAGSPNPSNTSSPPGTIPGA